MNKVDNYSKLQQEWEAQLASFQDSETVGSCSVCLKEFKIPRAAGQPPKTCSAECKRARKSSREKSTRVGRKNRAKWDYSKSVNPFEGDPLFSEPYGLADTYRSASKLTKDIAPIRFANDSEKWINWNASHIATTDRLPAALDVGETVLNVVPWDNLTSDQQDKQSAKTAKTVAARLHGKNVGSLINRRTDFESQSVPPVSNFYLCYVTDANGDGWCRWCSQREKDWKESFKALTAEFDRCPAHYATVLPPFFIGGFDEQQNGFQNLRPEYQVSAV
ncbi:MAG: hypothetical protein OSA11_10785 [Candidatus Nanopelagicales bacterium]|nr:hypothetical protein [Candidatus Nanopelagicales bacterium]